MQKGSGEKTQLVDSINTSGKGRTRIRSAFIYTVLTVSTDIAYSRKQVPARKNARRNPKGTQTREAFSHEFERIGRDTLDRAGYKGQNEICGKRNDDRTRKNDILCVVLNTMRWPD
jgi:hypothetical protein